MSKPPRPIYRRSTAEHGLRRADRFEHAPLKFAELVDLERSVAETEAELVVTGSEGDFARTLLEVSALLGHALALHQDLYAGEAYLGTAQSDASLVRQARRLAYTVDPGLSATGSAVLTIGAGLAGTLPQGFGLASVPRGEIKAQDYETLADLTVNAAWNAMLPAASRSPSSIAFNATGAATLRLSGTGFDLREGEPALLIGTSEWLPLTIRSSIEMPAARETWVQVEGGPHNATRPVAGLQFLAKPGLALHRFGWNAPSNEITPERLQNALAYSKPAVVLPAPAASDGYVVAAGTLINADIYLDASLTESLVGTKVLATGASGPQVYHVDAQKSARVRFVHGQVIEVRTVAFASDGTPSAASVGHLVETDVNGTVSVLQMHSLTSTVTRQSFPVPPPLFAQWRVQTGLMQDEPSTTAIGDSVVLAADLSGMRPGRQLVFGSVDGSRFQVVEVRKLVIAGGSSTVWWNPVAPLIAAPWTLGGLVVSGNVARLSHGRSVEQILGGSDGVTPFLRYDLKQAPVTILPSAEGGDPALTVRVNDVAWTPVVDFYESGPADRHYRLEFSADHVASVVFGDGRHGAIPLSGKKNITARYRTGLGAAGNAGPGQVSRIKKAHPLVDSAMNRTPFGGGAEPARLEDIRRQATRYVQTFDRAVSVQDHASLALLFPGVARASARWDALAGIQLVTATADGSPPAALAELRAFLDRRRDTGLPLVLLEPQPVDVYLTLTLASHPAYLVENVRLSVQERLFGTDAQRPGLFVFASREFGQAAHLSELYEAIEGVEGVTFMEVSRFSETSPAVVFDVLAVHGQQWLRLQPQNCDLGIAPGGTA